jgi:D-alanyl-D-alanine carboxypeptidase
LKVSANDAARLLAIDIAGSEDAYATMMNDAAASLGLTNTRAVNATGLDVEGQFSSARDLITVATVLSANADFRQTVMETTAQFNGQTIPNTNDLLLTYSGADGIKTGHTSNAGYCLLASATRHGRRIIVAVLGAPTDDARDRAATTLLDWAFTRVRLRDEAPSRRGPPITASSPLWRAQGAPVTTRASFVIENGHAGVRPRLTTNAPPLAYRPERDRALTVPGDHRPAQSPSTAHAVRSSRFAVGSPICRTSYDGRPHARGGMAACVLP